MSYVECPECADVLAATTVFVGEILTRLAHLPHGGSEAVDVVLDALAESGLSWQVSP